ncbi:NAD(P)H-dependent oxidoreductase [Marinicrinis sediminis]|uniref:NAD(P)H-dependent oxidoreductase n=1 Tax=Marinicrinis sediminis TaxID=1652465 RepID=A0ABW5RAG7_9BACL
MKARILIVNGHPYPDSYCTALTKAYAEGAATAAHQPEVREIHLSQLDFEPNLKYGFHQRMELEPDLIQAQADIRWADHIVFVYPVWWGTMPAILKGFIDRVFLPGFAFKYRENSALWDKLLKGKSARMIVTMDTPPWYYKWVYNSAGHQVMKRNILQFCGIKPVRVTQIGPVRPSSAKKRTTWLEQVKKLGNQLS